jgi:molybdopterin-biosynthesis enzyme MoeA-like protein
MAKTTTTNNELQETPKTLEEMEAYFAAREKELEERRKELNSQEKALDAKAKDLAAKALESEKTVEDLTDLKRRVKVQLPLDSLHKEPLFVRVNDYTCTIKRGVTVEVPYFVYLSIKESEDADAKTLMLLEDLNHKFSSKVTEYNI